jgi:chromosome partitioning protein
MAVVITIAQQKGGAGKTMLAANLAAAFSAHRRVALLDIDPQRSLARWHNLRATHPGAVPVAFSDLAGWRLGNELDRLRRECDVVIVDSPPHLDTDARRAVRAADLVLVPVQPSAPDLWAAEGTIALAAAERRRAVLVVNRAPTTKRLLDRALAEVMATGHTVLPAALGNRAGFAQAFAQGLGVMEAAPKTVAAAEMQALVAAIVVMMR